jgi:hypothetical protein
MAQQKEEREASGIKKKTYVQKLRVFNKRCNGKDAQLLPPLTPEDGPRRSKRTKVVSPDAPTTPVFDAGTPPNNQQMWSRDDIVAALSGCDGKEKALRVAAIVASKKSNYTETSGIYKLLKRAEKDGTVPLPSIVAHDQRPNSSC